MCNMYMCVCIYVSTCAYTHIPNIMDITPCNHVYVQYIHMCTMSTENPHTHTCMCIYICMRKPIVLECTNQKTCICAYINTHTHIRTRTHVDSATNGYMYVSAPVYVSMNLLVVLECTSQKTCICIPR